MPKGRESSYLVDEVRLLQRRANGLAGDVALLLAILLAALAPIVPLRRANFQGGLELYATIEMMGAIFGLLTGFALCLRFYSLGNRYHLFVGLAFFASGIKDFVHGLVCFPNLLGNAAEFIEDWFPGFAPGIANGFTEVFIPVTYVAGQMLLSFMLLLALAVPGWVKASSNRERETSRVSLIVLLLTLVISLALDYTSSRSFHQTALRPVMFASLTAAAFAMVAYLLRYCREQDLLSWWIAGSIGVNGVGQVMFLSSSRLFDGLFELAHLYKVAGYVLPLVGFLYYQIAVLLEYQRSQRELTQAREVALAAMRAKSEFLANISHEIRTPMNGIVGTTRRILKTPLNEEQSRYLQALRESADSLLTLLNDLLDFSKIEAGKFDLHVTQFSLPECVEEAHRSVALVAQEKGLRTSVSIGDGVPRVVVGDGVRLRQVLVNLLNNAVKFTDVGEISLRVRPHSVQDEKIVLKFTVRDTGIGIPTELQSDIFQPFHQADGSTTRLYGGTGLGLAICSQLVELMQGRIWVESEPGFGSQFHFLACFGSEGSLSEIDLSEHRLDRPGAPAAMRTRSPKRVLVAEDNKINQDLVAASLREMGHAVACVSNGQEAIDAAAGCNFDVILMDLQMPVVGGLDAATAIRDRSPDVAIFALTAHAMDSDKRRCLDVGMNGFLTKPVDDEELFALLESTAAKPNDSPSTPATMDEPASHSTLNHSNRDGAAESSEPLIDWEKLMRHVHHDRELLAEVAAMFADQSRELIDEIAQAIDARDQNSLSRAAHKLAGSVSNFHAPTVREAALRLERSENTDEWNNLRDQLDSLLKRLLQQLNEDREKAHL